MVRIVIEKEKIENSVVNMLKVNMGLSNGEKVLVVTDLPRYEEWINLSTSRIEELSLRSFTAKLVYEIGRDSFLENEFEFYAYPNVGKHGSEPPDNVAGLLKRFDVTIAITNYSISHTKTREEATETGVRIASMPTFLAEMFYPGGPMDVDYKEVEKYSKLFAKAITNAEKIKITSPGGTDLKLSARGREGLADTGIFTEKGAFGNLPAGEAYIAPLEGTGEGILVVQKGWFKDLKEDMILKFEKGVVTSIEGGGKVGDEFRDLLFKDEGSPYVERRNLAELGIGTNPNAKKPDNILEAEKIKGTCHIAIGDNSHFGGRVSADLHQDFVVPSPTLIVDGKILIEKGRWLI